MSKTASNIFETLLAFLPPIIWAIIIYVLSAQEVLPSLSLNSWDFVFKKSAHVIAYAILYWLLFRAFKLSANLTGHARWLVPLVLALTYAAFDEFHQSQVPGRTATLRDVGYDTLGCGLIMMRKFGYI